MYGRCSSGTESRILHFFTAFWKSKECCSLDSLTVWEKNKPNIPATLFCILAITADQVPQIMDAIGFWAEVLSTCQHSNRHLHLHVWPLGQCSFSLSVEVKFRIHVIPIVALLCHVPIKHFFFFSQDVIQQGHGGIRMPAIWFRYQLSPITAKYHEKRKPFYHFLTTVSARTQ